MKEDDEKLSFYHQQNLITLCLGSTINFVFNNNTKKSLNSNGKGKMMQKKRRIVKTVKEQMMTRIIKK